MAPQRHRYTKCVLFTGQRANKSNERVVCRYCSEAESPAWAYENALLCNTKKLVKNHLRRCRHFHAAMASGKEELIVFSEDEAEESRVLLAEQNKRKLLSMSGGGGGATTAVPSFGVRNKRYKGDGATTSHERAMGTSTSYQRDASAVPDRDVLERLLLNATLANGWSFDWVKNRASAQLFQHAWTNAPLPSSAALRGRILKTAGAKEQEQLTLAVEKEKLGSTLVLDSWRCVEQSNTVGVIITSSGAEVLLWDRKEVGDVAAFQQEMEQRNFVVRTLGELATNSVQVVAVMSDSSSPYLKARQWIRQQRRDVMYLPCFAHQLNALASDVFRLVPQYESVMITAMYAILWINRSQDLIGQLDRKRQQMGIPVVPVTIPQSFDWDSLRSVTSNLLISKDALKIVCRDAEITSMFPVSERVAQSIEDEDGFWRVLLDVDRLLFCFSRWHSTVKLDQSRLHCVPLIMHSIATTLQQISRPETTSLLKRLDDRWSEWEHPLMILAVVLNPALGWAHVQTNTCGVTVMRLGCWARYYFQAYFSQSPRTLATELLEFVEGDKFWCSSASVGLFTVASLQDQDAEAHAGSDEALRSKMQCRVVQYWKSCSADCPDLSRLALRIFSVAITSAATEDLFSDNGIASDQLNPSQQLAAMRVRARSRYDQRRNDNGSDQSNANVEEASTEEGQTKSGRALVAERTRVDARLKSLLNRWANQDVVDRPVSSGNENEAINSLYSTIHPADDAYSKYPITSLFPAE
ncbi:hypothetical protein Poli38472_000730 [Pythium oligandrum]|uniref:HAT C-terminal dimerisation domain-containing protein n=1 Tax=Pythium oligandrum TaxID=41045 RepID=A0A8K1FJF2_PYTOL|nr:hypothetical protein Poli38472_000730 [Pythium oligandrum]|eukprot:TMW60688.1 hypothetical protein Poli38472_000730 [Pythium oligandrum]